MIAFSYTQTVKHEQWKSWLRTQEGKEYHPEAGCLDYRI